MTSLDKLVRNYCPSSGNRDVAASLKRELLATVRAESLNSLVRSALDLKKQGRIDQAIPLLTSANRRQLDAIEAIQDAIDTLRGQDGLKVVFAKYRQFLPFEMGIENGDDVLSLLEDFAVHGGPEANERCTRLHDLETLKRNECDRLEFLERRFGDGSEDTTIAEIRHAIEAMDRDLLLVKYRILDDVLASVDSYLSERPDHVEREKLHMKLSNWLYILATSPTATRLADDVRTDA